MKELIRLLETIGVEDINDKCEKLEKYMHGILEWNQKINLTAIVERNAFIKKHYIDSLLCANMPEFKAAKKIIDVGTGAGFPGIPLAICFPNKSFLLMDSLAKRLRIVDELCAGIGLTNIETLHGRAEELSRKKGLRDSYDLCVSRAVANMSTLAEYCLPFVKTAGSFIAYKGPGCESEVSSASSAIEKLAGEMVRIDRASIMDFDENEKLDFDHRLIVINKIGSTPKAYPRKAGVPSKNPL